jgi:DNA polymerase-3 subunit beta
LKVGLTNACRHRQKRTSISGFELGRQGMKVVMQTAELARALYRVQGIADKKSTVPILGHVLLDADNEGLTVSATDTDAGLVGTYDAEVQATGRIAVQARQLYDVIKSISSSQVELCRGDNNWIDVKGGTSRFHLVGMAADEFPTLPDLSKLARVSLPAGALQQMIDRTLFCVSTDENRHNLSGIYCETPEPRLLRMVSTDGHRLALAEGQFDTDIHIPQGAIVPRKGFQELKRLLGDSAAQSTVEIGFSENSCVLYAGGVMLSTRLIEGQFPDYRQVIPQAGNKIAKLNRAQFAEALRRVSLLSQGRAHGVRFAFAEDSLELVAEDPEHGDARETLAMTYTGEPLTIGFNARYILDVLGLVAEAQVSFHLSDDLSPGVLRPEEDSRFLAVVMPMRI